MTIGATQGRDSLAAILFLLSLPWRGLLLLGWLAAIVAMDAGAAAELWRRVRA